MTGIDIHIDEQPVMDVLAELQRRGEDLSPAMLEISERFVDISEQTFVLEANPVTSEA